MENKERRMAPGELQLHFSTVYKKLDYIITRVDITNGRVQSLERWRMFIMGGLTILTVIIVPLIFLMLRQWILGGH